MDWLQAKALIPTVLQGQDGTAVWLDGGEVLVVPRKPQALVRDICNFFGIDMKIVRQRGKKLSSRVGFGPLLIDRKAVLVSLPFLSGKGYPWPHGFVFLDKVLAYQKCTEQLTTIWFGDATYVNCPLRSDSVGLAFHYAGMAREVIFGQGAPGPSYVREAGPGCWPARVLSPAPSLFQFPGLPQSGAGLPAAPGC